MFRNLILELFYLQGESGNLAFAAVLCLHYLFKAPFHAALALNDDVIAGTGGQCCREQKE
jgi:hypothetical protein